MAGARRTVQCQRCVKATPRFVNVRGAGGRHRRRDQAHSSMVFLLPMTAHSGRPGTSSPGGCLLSRTVNLTTIPDLARCSHRLRRGGRHCRIRFRIDILQYRGITHRLTDILDCPREAKFKHDQEFQFKSNALRNKLNGLRLIVSLDARPAGAA